MKVLIAVFLLLYLGCKYPHRNKEIVLGNWQYVALRDSTQTLDLTLDSLTISFGYNGKFELHYKEDTMFGFYKTKHRNKFDYIYVPVDRKIGYYYAYFPNKIVDFGKKVTVKNDGIYKKYNQENKRGGINILTLRNEKFKIINDSLIIAHKWAHQRTSVFKRIP